MEHEIFVIGTGTAGTRAAMNCAREGFDVAIADRREFGGTCALRGCVPKRVLHECVSTIMKVEDMTGKGPVKSPGLDWKALMEFKRTFTVPATDRKLKNFRKKKITDYHGEVHFSGRNELEIEGEHVSSEKILIATGARPRDLGIPGEELVITSEEVLDLEAPPGSAVFIGGGYVSFELACILLRAGTEVTISHRSDTPLKRFDREHVKLLTEDLKARGGEILLGRETVAVDRASGGVEVHMKDDGGRRSTVEADVAVHGAGRVPFIDTLELEVGGVAVDDNGIIVNDHLQSTSNGSVYVAGDANGRSAPLKLAAEREGEVAADNMMKGNVRTYDPGVVPSAVYTIPVMAMAGRTAEDLERENIPYVERSGRMEHLNLRRMISEELSAYRVLLSKDTDSILGVHLIGERSDEIMNVFTLAIGNGLGMKELERTIWTFPSFGSDIRYMLSRFD